MQSKRLDIKKAILLIMNYLIGYLYLYPILLNWLIDKFSLNKDLVLLIFYIAYTLFTVIIIKDILFSDGKRFINNLPKNILAIFKNYLLMLIFVISMNMILYNFFDLLNSNNQKAIEDAIGIAKYSTIFASIFFGPIVEESIFRLGIFRNLQKGDHFVVSCLISSFCFGLLHVYDSILMKSYLDCLYLLTYMGMGMIICRVYYLKDNFITCILLHMLNNLLGVLLLL